MTSRTTHTINTLLFCTPALILVAISLFTTKPSPVITPLYIGSIIVVLIINSLGIFIGTSVLNLGHKMLLHRWFAIMTISMLLWVNFAFLVTNSTRHEYGVLWYRLNFASVALFFLSFYHFFFIHFFRLKNGLLARVTTLASTFFIFATLLTPWLIKDVVVTSWGINAIPGPLNIIYDFYAVFLALGVIILGLHRYQKMSSPEKIKLYYLLIGLIIFVVFNIVFNVIVPLLLGSGKYQNLGDFSVVFFLAFTGYAIVEKRLFGIRFLVQRKIVNSGLGMLIVGVALASFCLWIYFTYYGASRNTIIIALFFFAFFVYPFILRRVESFVDRRILHYRRTSTETLQILSHNLNGAMEIATISKTILEELDHSLNLTGIAFYEPIDRTERFHCTQARTGRKKRFPSDVQLPQPLQHELKKGEVVYRRDIELLTHENPKAARYIEDLTIEILVPFVFKQKVIGLLVIAEKKYHEAFTADELKMIDALSAQLSTIIHRANLYERTRRFAQDLSVKVEKATKEIKRKNQQLQEVTESRNQFFADIAHEFKTPLTILKGNIDLVAQSANDEDRDLLLRELSRLENLTSDLLELSRNESGTQSLQHTTIDPLPFFDHLRDELSNFAAERKMTIHCDIDRTPFVADKEKISKLVSNLLSNAIKYGNANGNIWLTYKNHPQSIAISVRDDGPGIAKEHLPHLFERFYRVDKRESRAQGGTGLGLAIVKSIVDLHHGTIAVQSAIPDGTTFTITLPKT